MRRRLAHALRRLADRISEPSRLVVNADIRGGFTILGGADGPMIVLTGKAPEAGE